MSYLKSFTKVLENFINELSEMYPDDNHIEMAKNTIYLLKKTNPRKLLDFFYEYLCLPYETKIINKDETFFFNKNYDDEVSEYVKSLNVITNLKKYWSSMSEKTKETIWLYMNLMVKLSKKYKNAV